jgi:membrane protease YdiL (CAAX protease family)
MDYKAVSLPPLPLTVLFLSLFIGCVFVWGRVIERLLNRQPILPLEPHPSVPWRLPDLVIAFAVLFVAYAIPPALQWAIEGRSAPPGTAPTSETIVPAPAAGEDAAPDETGPMLPVAANSEPVRLTPWLAVAQGLSIVLGVVLIGLGLRHSTGATWSDFGLATRQPLRDIALGVAGMLAASVIVYMIQALMVDLIAPSEHPLLEMLKHQPSLVNLLLAVGLAAVVAPLAEEFVFRALVQGWLEVKERAWAERYPSLVGRLPTGMIAIIASAALFAVLHATQGPDPIALFPLALVLGYLYNRTHRLLPCIVMHLCFNGFSLLVLWIALSYGMSP